MVLLKKRCTVLVAGLLTTAATAIALPAFAYTAKIDNNTNAVMKLYAGGSVKATIPAHTKDASVDLMTNTSYTFKYQVGTSQEQGAGFIQRPTTYVVYQVVPDQPYPPARPPMKVTVSSSLGSGTATTTLPEARSGNCREDGTGALCPLSNPDATPSNVKIAFDLM